MDIVILCDVDFAGNMYNLASSVNRFTSHKALAIKRRVNHRFKYPSMLLAQSSNMTKVRELIYGADAIVWKEMPILHKIYGLDLTRIKDKENIVILGGGGFRFPKIFKSNQEFYKERINAKWAASSLDFLEWHPDWAWIPASIRVDYLRETFQFEKSSPPLIVASPSNHTNSWLGVQEQFEKAMEALSNQRLAFQFRFILGEPNVRCLRWKAPASIFFDRIFDIYGINSQEAGAFESAVITGASDFVKTTLDENGYDCPFYFVESWSQAAKVMSKLLKNPELMRQRGKECYEYVKKVHSGELAAQHLVRLIEE